jgi:hypothetical protein
LKIVATETSAAAATSATVTVSKPRSLNIFVAIWEIKRRVFAFFRSRRPGSSSDIAKSRLAALRFS